MQTLQITITGTVQGVGFRPYIYRLAVKNGLTGMVSNDETGVHVIVEGEEEICERFISQVGQNLPPLSRVESTQIAPVSLNPKKEARKYHDFSILHSSSRAAPKTIMPPDVSICPNCELELFDPENKRHHFPFITCTDCGPRYSIIKRLPYDRPSTSMAEFQMCAPCRQEYENPANRRYHAQPIGCFDCGPEVFLYSHNGLLTQRGAEVLPLTVKAIEQGKIVAIKGVGGYHLVCDAANDSAVATLRHRKNRPFKPFAVLVADLPSAKKLIKLDKRQEEILCSPQRPIVLAAKTGKGLSQLVAPQTPDLGIFLPYTPLHLLLLRELKQPIVATSANISDEPLCTNFKEIYKLRGVWDLCLEHNRNIINGCDDSVLAVVSGKRLTMRRARGYAPSSIELPQRLPQKVLAVGANQKNCVAIAFDNTVIMSPHIGDLNSIESVEYFTRTIEALSEIYNFTPDLVICDQHPGYESTKWANHYLEENRGRVKLLTVQHHHAHILAVMAEKKITGQQVLGVAFDGTGAGDDDCLWGGEFLLTSPQGYQRVAHFKYFSLLGGEQAAREPRRVALALLFELYGKEAITLDNKVISAFTKAEIQSLFKAYQGSLNSPPSSSCGRIFDAVGSLVGVCHKTSYEGECGLIMEGYYDRQIKGQYHFEIDGHGVINYLPMISEMLDDENPSVIISKFFNTLVEIIYTVHQRYKTNQLVLSGGVFQNKVLVNLISTRIPDAVFPEEIPPNDGGIALGQVASLLKGR